MDIMASGGLRASFMRLWPPADCGTAHLATCWHTQTCTRGVPSLTLGSTT